MKRIITSAALIVVLFGCASSSPRPSATPLAVEPRGATIRVALESGELRGELLEVRDSAVLILTEAGRLTLVGFAAIRTLRAEHMARRLNAGDLVAGRGQLRLGSRYPQGLNPELEHALLRVWNQTELDVVPRSD